MNDEKNPMILIIFFHVPLKFLELFKKKCNFNHTLTYLGAPLACLIVKIDFFFQSVPTAF